MRTVMASLVLLFISGSAYGDWSRCSSALEDLTTAAEDAETYAQRAVNAEQEYKDQQAKYEKCRKYPDTYDTYSDACDTLARRARGAKNDLESVAAQIRSRLSDIESAHEDVKSACVATGTVDVMVVCSTIRSMRGKYPDADLIAFCKTQIPEALCQACLGAK